MNHLPLSPENIIRVISNFFEKISEIFVSQGAPPVSTKPAANFATGTAGVVATSGKFATNVNIPVANLPPVSTIPAVMVSTTGTANLPPVANNWNNIRLLTP
jgi:hypothetical protein